MIRKVLLLLLIAGTPEAPVVSRTRIPAGTGSSPAFSGKDMFLREGDKLFCIGE